MSFAKKRKNKKFDYKPRYYKEEGNPYEMGHKFDEFRTTVRNNDNLKQKFNKALKEFNTSENHGANKLLIIIIAVLVFIFLYIIDFDLSIFKNPF